MRLNLKNEIEIEPHREIANLISDIQISFMKTEPYRRDCKPKFSKLYLNIIGYDPIGIKSTESNPISSCDSSIIPSKNVNKGYRNVI